MAGRKGYGTGMCGRSVCRANGRILPETGGHGGTAAVYGGKLPKPAGEGGRRPLKNAARRDILFMITRRTLTDRIAGILQTNS